MLVEQMVDFFVSWFVYPGLSWLLILAGTGLAIVFGVVWLAGYWPPMFKKYWLWAVFAGSGFLSLISVSFVQIPLQYWAGMALLNFFSNDVLMNWLLLAAIPQILLSGLVQEGAKMVPMVIWWRRSDRNIDPKLGLVIGAVAGAGLGVFEAVWAHNQIFAAGWRPDMVQSVGIMALAGFWERFFVVAFHIAVSALAGYGLARGRGWQFYLLVAFLHALINYSAVLLMTGIFSAEQVEIYVAVMAVLVTSLALWTRWKRTEDLV